METVLVIDDEEDIHYSFQRNFASLGWNFAFASSGEEGLKSIAKNIPSVVVMDIRMAGLDGIETLKRIRHSHAHLPVIMMTAHGTTQTAIETMKSGAFDYLIKPFDVERMQQVITSALKASRDMREKVSYQPLLQKEEYDQGIIGKTQSMQEVYKLIGQVSATDVPVTITGKTGTGKELVARAIVQHSHRANKPFLAVNCAAIPENLLESELFGHERGAFTGAMERRIGKFEQCHCGTIFLDEIGDMPMSTQAKILRVLQEGEISRLGSNQIVKINVRCIAATNIDLEKAVAAKQFREDLYYRLNVVRIRLPPLSERIEDIPLLVDYFLQRFSKQSRSKPLKVTSEALAQLKAHSWPGNVRELQNVIERASVVCASNTVDVKDLQFDKPRQNIINEITKISKSEPLELGSAIDILFREGIRDSKFKVLPYVERVLITRALAETQGNQVKAAKLLGITRGTLRKRIEKFGIKQELNVS
jgi:nitrogen regulation protein NR(I)